MDGHKHSTPPALSTQVPSFKQIASLREAQLEILISQLKPLNSFLQEHLYDPRDCSKHVPLFKQLKWWFFESQKCFENFNIYGVESHSDTSISQLTPVVPLTHWHEYAFGAVCLHFPPYLQGFCSQRSIVVEQSMPKRWNYSNYN